MVPNGTNYSYDGISQYLWYQSVQKWVAGVWFSFAGVCWCIMSIVIDRNGKIEKSMVPNGTNYSYDGISRYLWYQSIQKWVAGVWFSLAWFIMVA